MFLRHNGRLHQGKTQTALPLRKGFDDRKERAERAAPQTHPLHASCHPRNSHGETHMVSPDVGFKVEIFDLKTAVSSVSRFKTYPSGNFSGLFFTASLIRFVSTPYSSATEKSRMTSCLLSRTILLLTASNLTISFFMVYLLTPHLLRKISIAEIQKMLFCPIRFETKCAFGVWHIAEMDSPARLKW